MFSPDDNYSDLKKFIGSKGAGLFGVADISGIKGEFELSESARNIVKRAVCFGVGLSSLVLSEIEAEPTKLYYHHYRTANMFLDQLAFVVAARIEQRGFSALPVPASQITDWHSQKAHLSHKKIGYLAGLGWIGRNNLLVSREFGAQFRMATVLTDMDLKSDAPAEGGCGSCFSCVQKCPAGAIQDKQQDFNYMACFEKLKDFQKKNIVGQFICGVCVRACGKNEIRGI